MSEAIARIGSDSENPVVIRAELHAANGDSR